jgi:Outer membrane protein beta-barrel domain
MKKTFFISVLLFAIVTNSQAQSVKFGVKAGLNYANYTGTTPKTDAITSYHAGVVATVSVLDKFAIQPELLYSTQGATYKNATEDIKNEIGYLAIPVVAKINLSDAFSLELGPQASFLLSEKNKFNATDSKTFDFSVIAGLGLKITDNFFVEGRYVLGLTDVSTEAKSKNAVVQVSAGFMF